MPDDYGVGAHLRIVDQLQQVFHFCIDSIAQLRNNLLKNYLAQCNLFLINNKNWFFHGGLMIQWPFLSAGLLVEYILNDSRM